jgi:valyl-tRNA synthetase
MPFITEELFHRLPGANVVGTGGRERCGSIMVSSYPKPSDTLQFHSTQLDSTMKLLQDISHSARSTRASLGLTKQKLTMYIRCSTEELFQKVNNHAKDISVMSIAATTQAIQA